MVGQDAGSHPITLVFFPSVILSRTKGKAESGEITAAAHAADHHVRIFPDLCHLLLRLKAHYGLMHEHVVQDAPQGVPCVFGGDAVFNRLADRNAEASRMVGVLCQESPPCSGVRTGTGDASGAPRLHQHAAIRFLVVAYPHHVHLQFEPELVARKG